MSSLGTGSLAPAFELPDLDGHRRSLESFVAEGPVALVVFKLGCGTSELAAPLLERLASGYGGHAAAEGSRFTVVAVSQDDCPSTREFAQRMSWSFPVLLDEDLEASRGLGVESTPTLYLLRGAERLRAGAHEVPREESLRIVDLVEGWSRDGYGLVSDDIAARIGALPLDLFEGLADLPARRPG